MCVSPYVHMLQGTGICTYINKHASVLYVCMYGRMICVFLFMYICCSGQAYVRTLIHYAGLLMSEL